MKGKKNRKGGRKEIKIRRIMMNNPHKAPFRIKMEHHDQKSNGQGLKGNNHVSSSMALIACTQKTDTTP